MKNQIEMSALHQDRHNPSQSKHHHRTFYKSAQKWRACCRPPLQTGVVEDTSRSLVKITIIGTVGMLIWTRHTESNMTLTNIVSSQSFVDRKDTR
jgi:hypothetical protein